jgi:predicted RNase H-related nuclease YkuK (DUF458 family)
MLKDKKWFTLERVPVPFVLKDIDVFLNERVNPVIHIGTDAQKSDNRIEFVTCIGLVEPRKGGRCFYTRTARMTKECASLHQKLLYETQLTIELGLELMENYPEAEYVVHADVNPNPEWPSNRHVKEVVGYIMGMGFDNVLIKPDSWLASHCADHAVKHKNAR